MAKKSLDLDTDYFGWIRSLAPDHQQRVHAANRLIDRRVPDQAGRDEIKAMLGLTPSDGPGVRYCPQGHAMTRYPNGNNRHTCHPCKYARDKHNQENQ